MKMTSSAIGILAVLAAGQASAQSVNLTGPYRCIEACRAGPPGAPAFITQNGADISLLNEAGESVRAWPDWFAPASRIWMTRGSSPSSPPIWRGSGRLGRGRSFSPGSRRARGTPSMSPGTVCSR